MSSTTNATQLPVNRNNVEDQQVADLIEELSKWNPEKSERLELAKWSLESVTHLTEYEDEKANRILTAIAFLSALVSVLFAAIVQRYPFAGIVKLATSGQIGLRLLLAVYCLFAIYFILLSLGTTLTLWAVRPRFRIPGMWKHPKPTSETEKAPTSMLFFEQILKVSGKSWAAAFTQQTKEKLELEYTKNAILETYLIAQKIPNKLHPLKKGSWIFIASALVLVVLLPLCALTVACLGPTPASVISANVKQETPGPVVQKGDLHENTMPQTDVRYGTNGEPNAPAKKVVLQSSTPETPKKDLGASKKSQGQNQ